MPTDGLTNEQLGQLNYLHGVLSQPLGSWEGFYAPQSPSMNFALRYQLAFSAYAVAALSQHTPAYRAPYAEALRGAIEKMLHVASWGYWRASSANPQEAAASGHVAVLLSPHRQVVTGPPSDPIAQDNLQYSGHLSTMLGLYEKVSGDSAYDEPFTLHDPASGASYTYTHGAVAERIHTQMRQSAFGGVCCESGVAYVPCNNHALASNALHDALHGTTYSEANARWLQWVRGRMVLRGPAARGVFGAAYMKDLHMAAPVAFNFTDAWGLALMLPFDPIMSRKLYRRFRRKITRTAEGSYLDSSTLSEKMEISDVAINTAFALISARGVGDMSTAAELEQYSRAYFGAAWDGRLFTYSKAPRMVHANALYALASAVEPGGRNFQSLFNNPPEAQGGSWPRFAGVVVVATPGGSDTHVGVSQAQYEPSIRALHIVLSHIGSPAAHAPVEAEVTIENVVSEPSVVLEGSAVEFRRVPGKPQKIQFPIHVPPGGKATCAVHLG